ncbi:MAG TPA: hypothetical protein PK079_02235 [Leptospiraceae bacterium]|nr:hypothetical protein [Leptospiraceae bacterium]HMW03536.1 hypothetical protein [Leptospiraceae bacterium]HMX33901.1 hypothetical protein [Leptospiraceae bacterium]HMY29544.1 hypothetical protein [Leptospiraceae bacterium]HMZ64816.1 hypothetical protein [Leptospiraceae bacterium]
MLLEEIPESKYDKLSLYFSQQEVVYLTSSIATINAWNRIAESLKFLVPA